MSNDADNKDNKEIIVEAKNIEEVLGYIAQLDEVIARLQNGDDIIDISLDDDEEEIVHAK